MAPIYSLPVQKEGPILEIQFLEGDDTMSPVCPPGLWIGLESQN